MMIAKLIYFLKEGIWRSNVEELPRKEALLIKSLRCFMLVVRGLLNREFNLRACSLTYYTLLSIAPLIALCIAIARGFGLELLLAENLRTYFIQEEKIFDLLWQWALNFLDQAQSGYILGIGILILVWTVISILRHIEISINEIWQISKRRKLLRQLTDYLAIILIGPILFCLSSAFSIFLTSLSQMDDLPSKWIINPSLLFLLRLIPLLTTWIGFTLIFYFVPNVKVRFSIATTVAFAVSIIYLVTQWIYFVLQIGATNINIVYGSYAALPLFLIWVQLSWTLLLIGAKITHALQNNRDYDHYQEIEALSERDKTILSLAILKSIAHKFDRGQEPPSLNALCQELHLPIKLVQQFVENLIQAGFITAIPSKDPLQVTYLPKKNLSPLSIYEILQTLQKTGLHSMKITTHERLVHIDRILQSFDEHMQNHDINPLLKDIL